MAMAAGPVQEGEPIVDINTTPLIDVMLVLLIMLIVTLPPRRDAVSLDMPPPNPPPPPPTPPPSINVHVSSSGDIMWGAEVVGAAALEAKMRDQHDVNPDTSIMIIPERLAKYRYVARVMASAQRNNLYKIGVQNPR
jgi:biopolymer transport protein ExbD